MTLRRKTLLIVSLTLLSLMLLLYLMARSILLDSFTRLEEQNIRQHIQRVQNAISEDLTSLNTVAIDWAWWDDTYAFIIDHNQGYIDSNLVDETFITLELNLMLFIDNAGQIVFGQAFDLHNEQSYPVPPAIQAQVVQDALLWSPDDEPDVLSGLVMTASEPLLVISVPILDSEEEALSRGTMIWGRYLDALELQRYAEITQLSIVVEPFYDPQLTPNFQAARQVLSAGAPVFVLPSNEQSIAGYTLLHDVFGDPALLLRVDVPRNIYQQGQTTISYIILMVLITGAVFGLLTLLLLERFVLSRLANLTNAVMHIGISSDPTARVPVGALDELGELAMTINVMLQALEQSRDELALAHSHLARVARLAAAGEIAAGVAHQINNPLTAVVAESYLLLQEMEENTPEHESVTIIQEAARRAGDVVQQLLNLARSIPFDMTPLDVNASLTNAISLVRAQIEPHIAQIHASLANDLPPILGSPQHLEDVWINLFLNARDAVRDVSEAVIQVMTAPGSTDGEITITITDNGAGIAPQDLSHIFDPFYTTKQHGTGLGLSICHDVIERHGGAIGVESEDGLGTTFIITLPAAPADAAELSG